MMLTLIGAPILAPQVSAQEDDKTYIIATDTTFAPFEYQDDNGDFVGIDMDLLAAIAEDQGFNYEIRPLGFNAALQAVEAGQVDGMIAGMSITDERRQSFDFSETYFAAGVQFAVLEDSDYQALEDLDGENIAVKTGTQGMAVAESLADEYGFTITTFEDSVNMYEDLQAGNSSAVIEDYPVMAYAAETGGIPLRFIGDQMEVADYGFAVKKDQNDDLIALFNQGLTNIQASGQYDEIVANYLGGSTTEEGEVATTNPFVQLIQTNGKALLNGLWTTLWVTLVSFAIAAVLGIVVGLMRTSGVGILSVIAQIYIDIMRGMPLIVLAFFIYFGIPQLTGLQFGAYAAGITTLSLNAAAYIAEIVRGGINAVDKGQTEAARSLGLNQSKTMQRIILPQAFRIMIPSFINQFVITLKDTSILSVIGLVELTQTGRIIIARTYQSGAMWLIVGLMYIILITILTKISNRLEKEL